MQALAAWLIARPLNGVLALAATLPLQYLSFLSGAVLIVLILKKGLRAASVDALLAVALFALIGLVVKLPPALAVAMATIVWLPAVLLAVLLDVTRSLTLTLQLTVIVAVAIVTGFHAMVPDPVAFWQPLIDLAVKTGVEAGMLQPAALTDELLVEASKHMITVLVVVGWVAYSLACVIGYELYRRMPDEKKDFGRFQDISFGRVLAATFALASVAAVMTGIVWLQSIALVMFVAFWLQGLAIVHWMQNEGHVPTLVLVAAYVLIFVPGVNVVLVTSLAVVGYVDAWFRLRRPRIAVD